MSEADDWSDLGDPVEYEPPRDGIGTLLARLGNLERIVSGLTRGAPLRQAGIASETDLIRVLGSMDIEGALAVKSDAQITGDTEIAGALDVTGDTEISGDLDVTGLLRILSNATVTGSIRSQNFVANTSGWRLTSTGLEVNTLTAKDAIIGNQALAAPVTGDTSNASTGGTAVAISTGLADYATVNFTVPSEFSIARVMATSSLAMSNAVTINMRTRINGVDGTTMPVLSNSSGFGNGASSHALSIGGLTGGSTISVSTRCQATAGGTLGYVITSASVVYFR